MVIPVCPSIVHLYPDLKIQCLQGVKWTWKKLCAGHHGLSHVDILSNFMHSSFHILNHSPAYFLTIVLILV